MQPYKNSVNIFPHSCKNDDLNNQDLTEITLNDTFSDTILHFENSFEKEDDC